MKFLGSTFSIIFEALTCVISYFLVSLFVSIVSHGSILAIVGGILLFPFTLGIVLSGVVSNCVGIIKSIISKQKWYFVLLRILIFAGFVISVVLSFVV